MKVSGSSGSCNKRVCFFHLSNSQPVSLTVHLPTPAPKGPGWGYKQHPLTSPSPNPPVKFLLFLPPREIYISPHPLPLSLTCLSLLIATCKSIHIIFIFLELCYINLGFCFFFFHSIHVPPNFMPSGFFFNSWVMLCCINVPYFLYPFFC